LPAGVPARRAAAGAADPEGPLDHRLRRLALGGGVPAADHRRAHGLRRVRAPRGGVALRHQRGYRHGAHAPSVSGPRGTGVVRATGGARVGGFRQEGNAMDRGIFDRRSVLAGGAAVAGAGALALAGCGGDDNKSTESKATAGSGSAAKAPKRGGTLIVDSGEPAPAALVYAFNGNNYYLRN